MHEHKKVDIRTKCDIGLEQEVLKMNNLPQVKVGIVAVSRDCFPES